MIRHLLAWRVVTVPWHIPLPTLPSPGQLTWHGGLALPSTSKSFFPEPHYWVLSPGAKKPTD